MSLIQGKTVLARKFCLAELVASHLQSVGVEATVLKDRRNSEGHIDRVVVDSAIGLIHLTASNNEEPNGSIPTADFVGKGQAFLADKEFVAYGWNTKDNRTMIMFVPTLSVIGHNSLTKAEIRQFSNLQYSVALRPQA